MLATISKNKLQYLVAILIVVAVLAISAYRSGAVTRAFNEGRQAPAGMIYGPPGR